MSEFFRRAPVAVLAASLLAACASTATMAETLMGRVDVANHSNQTLVVAGITFQTSAKTTYSEALQSFASLKQGQKVSVEFDRSRNNVYTAKSISLED